MTAQNSLMSRKAEVGMAVAVIFASVLSGVSPANRAVWLTEMFWAWGLVVILLVTYR